MRYIVLGTGILICLAIAWAVRFHFKSSQTPPKFMLLSLLSAMNIIIFGRDLALRDKSMDLLAIALGLFAIAAFLLAWSLHASRSARLKLIYHQDSPSFILRQGPYRFIRHPFYASYIPFWTGCAVATLNPVNIVYALAIVPVLVLAALQEEMGFDRSPLAAEYAEYRRSAGLFWPKF